MSPLNINILLHYYTRTSDYAADAQPSHGRSSAVSDSLGWFVAQGLLVSRYGDICWSISESASPRTGAAIFRITDKGRAMVQALEDVQIPVCKWVQP